MNIFIKLGIPTELASSLLTVSFLVTVLNEIERIVERRVRDKRKQALLLNTLYFMRQLGCILLIVMSACLCIFINGEVG